MEPWLTGRHSHLPPVARLLCCCLDQSMTEVRKWVEPLDQEQIWACPEWTNSIGFHLRHLAGSVDRLTSYGLAEPLTPAQLQYLRNEAEPGAAKEELLSTLEQAFNRAAAFAETAVDFDSPRFVGRQRLETPLGVIIGHIAEHTQRHTGQLIVLAQFAAAARSK